MIACDGYYADQVVEPVCLRFVYLAITVFVLTTIQIMILEMAKLSANTLKECKRLE